MHSEMFYVPVVLVVISNFHRQIATHPMSTIFFVDASASGPVGWKQSFKTSGIINFAWTHPHFQLQVFFRQCRFDSVNVGSMPPLIKLWQILLVHLTVDLLFALLVENGHQKCFTDKCLRIDDKLAQGVVDGICYT